MCGSIYTEREVNTMKKNIVYSIEEYMEQGFTEAEAYAVRMHDKLFNRYYDLSEKEKNKMYAIVDRLGL